MTDHVFYIVLPQMGIYDPVEHLIGASLCLSDRVLNTPENDDIFIQNTKQFFFQVSFFQGAKMKILLSEPQL